MSIRAVAVAGISLLWGCAYKPGSFNYQMTDFEGTRATAGCLDVAVDREPDLDGAAVLRYAFGNRCDHSTIVDLGAVAVIGRTFGGEEVALTPKDPGHEIQALPIGGRLAGKEGLAYTSIYPLAQVCVDLASIGGVAPAQWHCFASAANREVPPPLDVVATEGGAE